MGGSQQEDAAEDQTDPDAWKQMLRAASGWYVSIRSVETVRWKK